MAPLVKQFKSLEGIETKVCVTGQHRQLLDQVLAFFGIIPDYDLNLMKANQNLYSLTADILISMKEVLEDYRPDYVFVHGDTTTSMAVGLATFYFGAKVCHVEAGLRTYNKMSPFPEEINRQITGRIADYHFTPTQRAGDNLIQEGILEEQILVTGNTVIDALLQSVEKVETITDEEIEKLKSILKPERKLILVTAHRRENHGQGFVHIGEALKSLALNNRDVQIVYPVHLNPNVQKPIYEMLSGIENISLISPLGYPAFVWLMVRSYLILTDSGGVQEEAPSLGKPVLVMRDTTERPEAVEAGTVILVGTDKMKIIKETEDLLRNTDRYKRMEKLHNPYGDGNASKRIATFIKEL